MRQHELIADLAQQVRQALADGDEPTARTRFGEMQSLLTPHNKWEEHGLFARLTRQGDYADQVRELEAEHTGLHAAIDQAGLTLVGWRDAVTRILDELDEHIRKENLELFPAAHAVLDAEDWAAVDAAAPSACACGGRCGAA
ncbi:hemerythrin domain-containing protein [Streptomyces luteolifulvus]|jgi:hypothetical protein|nr:hemerythrin domain-containing protein [Streptomyces luteolifulvus]